MLSRLLQRRLRTLLLLSWPTAHTPGASSKASIHSCLPESAHSSVDSCEFEKKRAGPRVAANCDNGRRTIQKRWKRRARFISALSHSQWTRESEGTPPAMAPQGSSCSSIPSNGRPPCWQQRRGVFAAGHGQHPYSALATFRQPAHRQEAKARTAAYSSSSSSSAWQQQASAACGTLGLWSHCVCAAAAHICTTCQQLTNLPLHEASAAHRWCDISTPRRTSAQWLVR